MTNSQIQTEGYHFNIRKHLVEYDDVLNKHREVICAERRKILTGAHLKDSIRSMVEGEIRGLFSEKEIEELLEHEIRSRVYDYLGRHQNNPRPEAMFENMARWLTIPDGLRADILSSHDPERIVYELVEHAKKLFKQWSPERNDESRQLVERLIMPTLIQDHLTDRVFDVRGRRVVVPGIFPALPSHIDPVVLSRQSLEQSADELVRYAEGLHERLEQELGVDVMRLHERTIMLMAFDHSWMEHLKAMERLREGIGLRAVGQEQPLVVYKRESHASFEALLAGIGHDVAIMIYRPRVATEAQPRKAAVMAGKSVGRNDPCPCGSGKKYKHCCGK